MVKLMKDTYWNKLKNEVILPGLCTQCGSCVGLSENSLSFREFGGIPFPTKVKSEFPLKKSAYEACPAKHCDYSSLNNFVFGKEQRP